MEMFLRTAICLVLVYHLPLRASALQKQDHAPVVQSPPVFRITPGPDNPRNSEGDFVTLKDGKILFVYSRYTGTSGADNATAYLAGRISVDGGSTWSLKDETVVENEGAMNVMSVSL